MNKRETETGIKRQIYIYRERETDRQVDRDWYEEREREMKRMRWIEEIDMKYEERKSEIDMKRLRLIKK